MVLVVLFGVINIPDHAIGTLSNDILDFILIGDIEGDLPRATLGRKLLHHVAIVND